MMDDEEYFNRPIYDPPKEYTENQIGKVNYDEVVFDIVLIITSFAIWPFSNNSKIIDYSSVPLFIVFGIFCLIAFFVSIQLKILHRQFLLLTYTDRVEKKNIDKLFEMIMTYFIVFFGISILIKFPFASNPFFTISLAVGIGISILIPLLLVKTEKKVKDYVILPYLMNVSFLLFSILFLIWLYFVLQNLTGNNPDEVAGKTTFLIVYTITVLVFIVLNVLLALKNESIFSFFIKSEKKTAVLTRNIIKKFIIPFFVCLMLILFQDFIIFSAIEKRMSPFMILIFSGVIPIRIMMMISPPFKTFNVVTGIISGLVYIFSLVFHIISIYNTAGI
ncbi:MAG: hypothetical protein A2Y33_07590 [Spirochaetes bacterium GWF1_51_8]|nr:MAG: hypothetical protein A2Y33_07590 [Spirochaetes bacterium GWF1_51_8]